MVKLNKIGVFLFLIAFLFSINSVYALSFDYINPDIQIWKLSQLCSIENGADLHCNTLVYFFIINKTNSRESFEITELNQMKFDEESIKLCNLSDSIEISYRYFNVSCYDSKINWSINDTNTTYGLYSELKLTLNLKELDETEHILQFNYIIYDFVFKDSAHDNLFLNTYNLPNNTFVWRSIILPKDSTIESLYNFKVIAYNKQEKKWIIATDKLGESTASYRDMGKEQKDRNKRDLLIIIISLSLSFIMSTFFSNRSKRIKNILSLLGLLFLIPSMYGVMGFNMLSEMFHIPLNILSIILIIFYISAPILIVYNIIKLQ